jgi:hypothetical protein
VTSVCYFCICGGHGAYLRLSTLTVRVYSIEPGPIIVTRRTGNWLVSYYHNTHVSVLLLAVWQSRAGTTRRGQCAGVLAGLAILKLYFECLGTTWTGNPARGPIVFFRAADMADTSKWQRLPAESDKNPAEAYSFAESAEPLSWTRFRQIIRTRASPRPPTIGLIS